MSFLLNFLVPEPQTAVKRSKTTDNAKCPCGFNVWEPQSNVYKPSELYNKWEESFCNTVPARHSKSLDHLQTPSNSFHISMTNILSKNTLVLSTSKYEKSTSERKFCNSERFSKCSVSKSDSNFRRSVSFQALVFTHILVFVGMI